MTGMLAAGAVVAADTLELSHEELPAEQIRDGAPTTGWTVLGSVGDAEIGVWEMTPGTAVDVETDEVFVVIAGRGRVAFTHPAAPAIEVRPGSVVRLAAGMRTEWTVSETLRKVYLAPPSPGR